MPAMLNLWRRHTPKCPHRKKGRAHIKCKCPIWVDGELHGHRFRHSTGTRDWRRAIKKLADWESSRPEEMKSFAEAADSYLLRCQDLSRATRVKYGNVMRHLLDFCEQRGIDRLAELSVEVLDGYRAQRTVGRLTAVKELQTLRQFCGFCLSRGWLNENPAKHIKAPRAQPKPVEPYTAEELSRIRAACEAFGRSAYERRRAKAMVLLLRHTALRISDVATLARSRVRDEEILLHTLKTGGLVKLPLPPDLRMALEALPRPRGMSKHDPCPYFFWNGIMGREAVIRNVRRTLGAVFKKAGIPFARTHRFRHTLATDILAEGGTIQDVADVLGISPKIAADHYAKWTQSRQDRISGIMRAVQNARETAIFGTNLAHTQKERVIQ